MIDSKLLFGLLVVLAILFIWLGKRASADHNNNEDYFLIGRKLSFFSLFMALFATQIGGGALIGASDEAFKYGLSVLFYPLGIVIGLIILSCGYGAKMQRLHLTTVSEIFEKIYDSSRLRKIASILSILSLYVILIGQAIAARKFFCSFGQHSTMLYVGVWLILVMYTVMGGLKAVVSTDILQAIFICCAFSLSVTVSFCKPVDMTIVNNSFSASQAPWFSWLILPPLFMLIEQDMEQLCFAAKNPKIVSLASLCAGCSVMMVSLVPIYFGYKASILGLNISPNSSVLIASTRLLTNPPIATIVICAILMAIVSTADSILCSISSNIACDFLTNQKSVFSSKFITGLVGVSTLSFSFFFNNIVAMIMFSYDLAVSVLLVPISMAIVCKNKPKAISAKCSMIIGLVNFVIFRIWPPPLPKEIFTVTLSIITFFAVEFISPKIQQTNKSLANYDD